MNIEQYRALKAQEEAERNQQPVEQPTIPKEEDILPEQVETKQESEVKEETKPEVIIIDGKEVTVDELKNGYLRQSDYTKKTQELAHQRKEVKEAIELYNILKHNPQAVQTLQQNIEVPKQLDPTQSKVFELEQKLYDIMLQQEINTLQSKYPDFEVMEVMEMASQKQLTNLEDAYHLVKSNKQITEQSVDIDKLKEQLKQQLIKELEDERNSTSTIITTNNVQKPIDDNKPKVSEGEMKVAANMGLSVEEYIKWRDVTKK